MSNTKIGDVCSRIRSGVKAVRQDSFLTDQFIYSLFLKYAAPVIRRYDERGRLLPFASIFETLDYVKLVECDWIEAGCSGVKSYKTFRKTASPMPMFTEGAKGPIVRSITSLDGSVPFQLVNLDEYILTSRQPNFRYNTTKYCWYLNDLIYFPNVDYPAVRIEGMFQDDISQFKCCYDTKCCPRQEQSLNVPDSMLQEIETNILNELNNEMRIPSDSVHDAVSPTR